MLKAVRAGMNIRQAGQQFGFRKSTVAFWVERAHGKRLDRVDLANRKPGRASNRTAFDVEQRIAQLRIDLRESVLGEYGARAIRAALQAEMARVRPGALVGRELMGWLERQKIEPAEQVVDLFKRHQMMRVERRDIVKLEGSGVDGDVLAGWKYRHATRIVASNAHAVKIGRQAALQRGWRCLAPQASSMPREPRRWHEGGDAVDQFGAASGAAGHCRRGRIWRGRSAGARRPIAATVPGRRADGRNSADMSRPWR